MIRPTQFTRALRTGAAMAALAGAALGQDADPPASDAQESADSAAPAPIRIDVSPGFSLSEETARALKLDEPLRIAEDVLVTHAGFGTYEPLSDGTFRFEPTRVIELGDTRRFGWMLRFDTTRDSLVLVEKFTLPKGNQTWTVGEDTTISEDGLTATTAHPHSKDAGFWDWAFNFWGFDPGDPTGKHQFEILLDDKSVRTFEFEVVEAKPSS